MLKAYMLREAESGTRGVKRALCTITILIPLLSCLGCTAMKAHSGSETPKEQMAERPKEQAPLVQGGFWGGLDRYDFKVTTNFSGRPIRLDRVTVSPGLNTLEVVVMKEIHLGLLGGSSQALITRPVRLTFHAEAGRVYRVKGEPAGLEDPMLTTWFLWMEDAGSGNVVSQRIRASSR